MYVLVKAYTYLKETNTKNEICKCLRMTNCISYNALNSIDYNTITCLIPVCEKSEDSKCKESTIIAFCYLEESSAIDSNCQRIVTITMNGVEE